jgi:hypothetical protein
MNAGNPIAVERVVTQDLAADECQIQIACAGTIGVKWCPVAVPLTGHRATSHDGGVRLGNGLTNDPAELLELRFIASERQANHVASLFGFRQCVVVLTIQCLIRHAR